MPPEQREYQVSGMTCDHCVAAVTEEVQAVDSVTSVEVELRTGRLVVRGQEVDDEKVRAAVEEAGYEAVPAAA